MARSNVLKNRPVADPIVLREAREQSALMAENYLTNYDNNCIKKSFCEVATTARIFDQDQSKAAKMSVK
jgi:hypothetical protein